MTARTALRIALPVLLASVIAMPTLLNQPSAPAATPVTAQPVVVAPQLALAASSSQTAAVRDHLTALLSTSTSALRSSAVDVDGLGVVLRQGSEVLPASTEKLFTSVAALKALGPAARMLTTVRAPLAQQGALQPGSLYLVGGGDPFFNGAQLEALAAGVRAAGITRIGGALVVDDLRYDAQRRAPGWKTEFVPDESGPLSALAVDGNRWRKDSAYLSDPGIPTLQRFRDLLIKHGVAVGTRLLSGTTPASARTVTSQRSAPMEAIVRKVDKYSDNFGAELLLKEVGHRVEGTGTSAAGARAVESLLGAMKINVGSVYDGSGLSSKDRQSAAGEVSLLNAVLGTSLAAPLRSALPIACKDGTLKQRMCSTAAAGRADAKTGTLPGTYALSGYTTTADGHTVRFSFLLSRSSSGSKARAAIDACVVYLSALRLG
ncbi:MAG: D-alanyl-D-alanine carboxypeptidase/D-alanyl-D-alanine-endopeptidase [Frankiales bacterium]|nr:D-alanyl-D-alanine carboxypeptidase/D-alanyl-D-alanine-endopeptidase [Frankiales bacterium]